MVGSTNNLQDFFTFDPHTFGTKGLIFVGDKVVVYRRGHEESIAYPGTIDLPGGANEGNETPFETLARELYEEFRLRIDKSHITYARRYESTKRPGNFAWYAVAKLPASAQKDIVFGDEGLEWLLMTPQEFTDLSDAWPVLQKRTVDYLETAGT